MTQTARDYCRLGRQQKLTRDGHEKAKQYYQQALAEEPDYLPAHAEYSYVMVREFQNLWGEECSTCLDKALGMADHAVALGEDATNAMHNDFRARWYRAMVYWNQGSFDRSFDEFEAARLLIDPARSVKDNAHLDADMAEAYVYYGRPDRAIELVLAAMEREPEFPYWFWWNLGRAYYMAGRYQDALDAIDRIADPPNDVHLITAASRAQLGDISAAEAIMAEFSRNEPDWSLAKSAAYPYGSDAARQHWLDGLRKAGLREN